MPFTERLHPEGVIFSSYAGIWKDGFRKMKYIQLLDSFQAGTFIGAFSDKILNRTVLSFTYNIVL